MTQPNKPTSSTSPKAALKGMLKECLRELIEEGAFGNIIVAEQHVPSNVPRPVPLPTGPRPSSLPQNNNDYLNDFVGNVAREASSGNGKMAEMLKEAFLDTAMTTMVNQREGKNFGKLDEFLPEFSHEEQTKMDDEIAQIEALAGGSVKNWARSAGIKRS